LIEPPQQIFGTWANNLSTSAPLYEVDPEHMHNLFDVEWPLLGVLATVLSIALTARSCSSPGRSRFATPGEATQRIPDHKTDPNAGTRTASHGPRSHALPDPSSAVAVSSLLELFDVLCPISEGKRVGKHP
jgi:hypothetical protein